MTKLNTIRRSCSALLLAVGMLAVAASGASAGALQNGSADAQALRITLTVPSSDALKTTLAAVGADVSAIPAGLFKGQTLQIDISQDHGDITLSGSNGSATVYAIALNGAVPLSQNKSVTSSCKRDLKTKAVTSCASDDPIAAAGPIDLNGLGTIEIAGASSQSPTPSSTSSKTSLVKVHLDLRSLFAGALAPLTAPVATATDAVNGTVLPAVNGVLKTVETAVGPSPIDGVTLGTINNIPSIANVPLLDLTVLPGGTTVTADKAGSKVTANATSEIEDMSVLGGWFSLTSVQANAQVSGAPQLFGDFDAQLGAIAKRAQTDAKGADAMAAQVNKQLAAAAKLPAPAKAGSSLIVGGGSVGGLANVDLDKVVTGFKGLAPIVSNLAKKLPDAAAPAATELVAAATLADNITGVSLLRLAGDPGTISQSDLTGEKVRIIRHGRNITVGAPDGANASYAARASSDQLVLNVAPKLAKLASLQGKAVPNLSASDFVASGVQLRVEMPKAAAQLGNTVQVAGLIHARTGVGTHALAALVLIGAAVLVKRFALNK